MALSPSRKKKPKDPLDLSELKRNYKHSKGDLVMVEAVVDEYSIHDVVPGLVLRNVRDYDSFAQIHYNGKTQWAHVNRIKRAPNARS